jgi:transposase-like protein
MEASEFRRAVAARNRGVGGGGRRRFGAELRARAVALVGAARRGGRGWDEIAVELGVRATLLQKWCRGAAPPAFVPAPPALVRVEVEEAAPDPASGGMRLVSPAGYVVEGLDVVSAAELLRRLR